MRQWSISEQQSKNQVRISMFCRTFWEKITLNSPKIKIKQLVNNSKLLENNERFAECSAVPQWNCSSVTE